MRRLTIKVNWALSFLMLSFALNGADHPSAIIANGLIEAHIYLPDAKDGFYRGTRFDWSATIYSLKFQGHDYYGPWFTKTDPAIHDFEYQGPDIVAGPCSATTGPSDEFKPVGFDNAQPGQTFVKIGVGALRKPDSAAYDNYRLYEIANSGAWHVTRKRDSIEFVQTLKDSASGYGYIYTKSVLLMPGRPEMVLRHTLKNTGSRAIITDVYNHNFLVLDHQTPGPGVTITVPFAIQTPVPPHASLATIHGNQIAYVSNLKDHDTVAMAFHGFGDTANDNSFRIENAALGAGLSVQSDRPLLTEELWSIRSVIAMEPFIAISIEPGQEFSWTSTYEYYKLPRPKQ